MPTDVKVPTLGESITEATLGAWLKHPGDAVAADEPIATLETDKVSVDVPSPVAGIFGEALVKEGDTVAVGALIARIGEGAAASAAAATVVNPAGPAETPALKGDANAPDAAKPGASTDSASDAAASDSALRLSPAVRRAVLENHVDPSAIQGSGKDGRLTKDGGWRAPSGRRSRRRACGRSRTCGRACARSSRSSPCASCRT